MKFESSSPKIPPKEVIEKANQTGMSYSELGQRGANVANDNRRKRLDEEASFLEYDKGIREEEAKKLHEATNAGVVPFNEDDQN